MSGTSEPCTGYFGKIPARGDFVNAGLPSSTVKAWDLAVSAALAGSKTNLGEHWSDIWLEAPVWRFAFPETMCGASPLLGLWMPSIDKVGRFFPLMIAATCPGLTPETMARHGTVWLDLAEHAGRSAIADDLTPEQLTALIQSAPDIAAQSDTGLPDKLELRPGVGLWWTEGSPRVPAQGRVLDTMPDRATFTTMLDATYAAT
jgi:type VI secretion system protein ImpM